MRRRVDIHPLFEDCWYCCTFCYDHFVEHRFKWQRFLAPDIARATQVRLGVSPVSGGCPATAARLLGLKRVPERLSAFCGEQRSRGGMTEFANNATSQPIYLGSVAADEFVDASALRPAARLCTVVLGVLLLGALARTLRTLRRVYAGVRRQHPGWWAHWSRMDRSVHGKDV